MNTILVLRTDDCMAERNIAWVERAVYEEDNQIAGIAGEVHSIFIGYGGNIGTVYQGIMNRPKLPVRTWKFTGKSDYDYRLITEQEAQLLESESEQFKFLRNQDKNNFKRGVIRLLNEQASLIERDFKRKYVDTLSSYNIVVASYLYSVLPSMMQDSAYWGIRYMDVEWSSDIRTVKFAPFNVIQELQRHPDISAGIWTDERLFLSQLYRQPNGNPIGPRVLGYSPSYEYINGYWKWVWQNRIRNF